MMPLGKNISLLKTQQTKLILGLACVASFFHFYIFNKTNMNVIDEMQYMFGILGEYKDSAYPSPLFFFLNKHINISNNIVENARFLNLIFYLFGLIPIYKLAKKYLDYRSVFFIVIFYLFSPFSQYITNVMPEIIFGTFFYWILFVLDKIHFKPNLITLLILSLLEISLIYTKNHGIFLIPVIALSMFLSESNIKKKFITPIIFVLLVFAEKFIIDTYINSNISIFGGVYEDIYKSNSYINSEILTRFLFNFSGHFLYIIIFLSPIFLFFFFRKNELLNFFSRKKFVLFIYILTIFLVFISSYYIAFKSDEIINRLHERYYAFVLTPLLIAYFSLLSEIDFGEIEYKSYVIISALLILIASIFLPYYYQLSYIDNANINSFFSSKFLFIGLIFILIMNFIRILKFHFGLISILIIFAIFISPLGYIARKNNTPPDSAGLLVCKNNLPVSNVYVDNFVSFGFFYYNCPGKYTVNYFDNFDFKFKPYSIYIGSFVYKNAEKFSQITKFNHSIFFKE
jgi:hypothetical protein